MYFRLNQDVDMRQWAIKGLPNMERREVLFWQGTPQKKSLI